MNRFYFCPAVDTLCIADGASIEQQRVFYKRNECGLLPNVQIIVISSDLSMTHPYSQLRKVIIIHRVTAFVRCCRNCEALHFVGLDDLPSYLDLKGLKIESKTRRRGSESSGMVTRLLTGSKVQCVQRYQAQRFVTGD
jgi:hypothetical protein